MFVIFILVVIATFVFVNRDRYTTFGEALGLTACFGVFAAIAWAVVFGLASWYANVHPSPVRNQTYDIVALSMGSETSGSYNSAFFVGFGYINSEPMYYYYYKTDNGFRFAYTNADLTEVVEDATPETSTITYFCEDHSVPKFFSWPFPQNNWSDCFNYVNEIHMPPNSIDMEFNANLPNQE